MRSRHPARSARSSSVAAALFAALAIAGVVACAQGSNGTGDDIQTIDARRGTDARSTDARPTDAGNSTDARPTDARPPIDSGLPGIDSGLPGGMCMRDADCPAADECCLLGVLCGPDPGIPGFCTP